MSVSATEDTASFAEIYELHEPSPGNRRHDEYQKFRSGSAERKPQPVLGQRELYIYWTTYDLHEAMLACSRMQELLRTRIAGLQTELLRRDKTSEGRHTLMEIYRHPDGVDSRLESVINNAVEPELASKLASPRMVEAFHGCLKVV